MSWLMWALLPGLVEQQHAEDPAYEVIDFERRELPDAPPDLADEGVPDLPGVLGLPIGDSRERPWGQYCGVLWQAAYPLDSRNADKGGWWVWDAHSLQAVTRDGDGRRFRWYPATVLDGLPSSPHVASNYGAGAEWTWLDPPETWETKCTCWFVTQRRLAGLWLYQTGDWGVRVRALDGRATEPVTAVQKWVWLRVGWDVSDDDGRLFVFVDPKYRGGWVIDNIVLGDDPPDPANLRPAVSAG